MVVESTNTSFAPLGNTGVVQVIVVVPVTERPPTAIPPIVTATVPPNPVPRIVMTSPPAGVPVFGVIDEIVGKSLYVNPPT